MDAAEDNVGKTMDRDGIGDLLRLAGHRRMPDTVQLAAARAAAHAEWSRVVRQRRWQRHLWPLTGAAVAAAITIVVWMWPREPAVQVRGSVIAAFQQIKGSVFVIQTDGSRVAAPHAGHPLRSGDRVETSTNGRAAFTLAGASVRLDRGTTVVLASDTSIALERGAVYVDSQAAAGAERLFIETALGRVRHVGTQFEVRLLDRTVHVRVREGAVVVDQTAAQWTSRAGESLVFVPGREPARQAIATFGPAWTWIGDLAPPFHLEGASVTAFLDWVSREQGWRWELADRKLQSRVGKIVLHGSVDGLSPEEALDAVLPTCGLTSRRDGNRLIIGLNRESVLQ